MTLLDIRIQPPRGRRGDIAKGQRKKTGPKPRPDVPARTILGSLKSTPEMGRKTRSRIVAEPLAGREARMPSFDHPAITEARTLYPTTVKAAPAERALKTGSFQAKLGGMVLKGKWKGMPIYALTLEERATCPTSCQLWRACYGNNMPLAHRLEAGEALERKIRDEVRFLAMRHPEGFVVRLHVLGDFYSERYVQLWAAMLAIYPMLRVFGYSARWERTDPIAVPLIKLAMAQWDRFAIRFSNAPIDTCSTVTIEHPGQRPADAIICPQQLGQTESCSTCALCWQTDKRIAFIRH